MRQQWLFWRMPPVLVEFPWTQPASDGKVFRSVLLASLDHGHCENKGTQNLTSSWMEGGAVHSLPSFSHDGRLRSVLWNGPSAFTGPHWFFHAQTGAKEVLRGIFSGGKAWRLRLSILGHVDDAQLWLFWERWYLLFRHLRGQQKSDAAEHSDQSAWSSNF